METNKPTIKKATKKKAARKRKNRLTDDPPIIIGGGGSTLVGETFIKLPEGTPKMVTSDGYDVYRVAWNIADVITTLKRNGRPKRDRIEGTGWESEFWQA